MDFYHALNRGVDGKTIFPESGDYIRFIRSMYLFNDVRPANNTTYALQKDKQATRRQLVDIHGWCLMRNHYHLLLSEKEDQGISAFLRKLNVGYAKYFNEKYHRHGYVFQGSTKKVPIVKDSHFNHILHYIHLNPLDYLRGSENWRERAVRSASKAEAYLQSYRFSSYLDYCGKSNFPSVVTTSFFKDAFGPYPAALKDYLRDIEIEPIKDLALE